jgi:hypothetical protein
LRATTLKEYDAPAVRLVKAQLVDVVTHVTPLGDAVTT